MERKVRPSEDYIANKVRIKQRHHHRLADDWTVGKDFTRSLELLCPVEWKNPLKDDWQMVLDRIIISESPESYVTEIRDTSGEIDPHIQFDAQKSSLLRRLKNAYGIDYKALLPLKSIYLVSIGGKKVISKISDEQKKLLKKINVELEVH